MLHTTIKAKKIQSVLKYFISKNTVKEKPHRVETGPLFYVLTSMPMPGTAGAGTIQEQQTLTIN